MSTSTVIRIVKALTKATKASPNRKLEANQIAKEPREAKENPNPEEGVFTEEKALESKDKTTSVISTQTLKRTTGSTRTKSP